MILYCFVLFSALLFNITRLADIGQFGLENHDEMLLSMMTEKVTAAEIQPRLCKKK